MAKAVIVMVQKNNWTARASPVPNIRDCPPMAERPYRELANDGETIP
jgi:hypothetical protein